MRKSQYQNSDDKSCHPNIKNQDFSLFWIRNGHRNPLSFATSNDLIVSNAMYSYIIPLILFQKKYVKTV